MNKARRAAVQVIRLELEALAARLDTLAQDEQDALDNLPDGLVMDSGQALDMEEAAGVLEEAKDTVEHVASELEALEE
jgi:hypothetical protein